MKFKVGDKPYYYGLLTFKPYQITIKEVKEDTKQYVDNLGRIFSEHSLFTTEEDARYEFTDKYHF
jgi:hypothetical protein